MLLSQKTKVRIGEAEAKVIRHMCCAAYKLWNICNYERRNYREMGLEKYPDWYYQKKKHKDNDWYKQLPSQTAQEVCKQLEKSWKSYYVLQKTGGIENPRPPRYKQEMMAITYMQNGIRQEEGSGNIRLTLSKKCREYMKETYQIDIQNLRLENTIFRRIGKIKQIRIYPPRKGTCELIVIYEEADVEKEEDTGRYLSIDLGLHNLMTCYDSESGESFVVGRRYQTLEYYYYKEIGRVQSQWYQEQSRRGIRYPKGSKHIRKLYEKKNRSIRDYLHKMTHYIAKYCKAKGITRVIIGDIRHIRDGKNLGKKTNQKLHGLPYEILYKQLEYKLKRMGKELIRQEESYSSQCSPKSPGVGKEYAEKKNRRNRGLYVDAVAVYNADAVGAYNILRKYIEKAGLDEQIHLQDLRTETKVIKVAV